MNRRTVLDRGGRCPERPAGALRMVALSIALTAITLLVAACGGSNSSGGSGGAGGTSATGESSNYDKAVSYAQCIRAHGEPGWPDPNSQGNFVIDGNQLIQGAALNNAQNACQHFLPNGGQTTAAQQQKVLGQMLKFAECMRSHGLPDFPDPIIQNGQALLRPPKGVLISSPQFQNAQNACQSLMPGSGAS